MNWIEWKALHELHQNGEVPLNQTLTGSDVLAYLENSLGVVERTARKLKVAEGYHAVYEKNYKTKFDRYFSFLQENDLVKPQSRFEEQDLDILISIKEGMDSGEFTELRNQIIAADESLRGVSLMFFKNEKYLLGKNSVVDALKNILQVKEFSNEKDQQYIYKLECHHPRVIVLCENLDLLTRPNKPRKHGIELWYAGGKNIQKLNYSPTRSLPIYYSCDWDFDGLTIYSWVKEIIPEIQLLTPSGKPRSIKDTGHNSHWLPVNNVSTVNGIDQSLFLAAQIKLIEQLIIENCWIIEESNDLLKMLSFVEFKISDS
jgi:hypothetical protein